MSSVAPSGSGATTSVSRSSTPTPSASSSPTTAPQQSNGDNSVNFYRNLFYILIGLLGVFALISILSLLRARHRRKLVHAEARRMGVLVPGMPGYISLRERRNAREGRGGRASTADTTNPPDWWEVGAAGWMTAWLRPSAPSRGYSGLSTSGQGGNVGTGVNFAFTSMAGPSKSPFLYSDTDNVDLLSEKSQFRPLAIIPPQSTRDEPVPIPNSSLKFFPVNSAYRPEDLVAPPLLWGGEGVGTGQVLEQVDGLGGKRVDVVTMIRMPETPEQIETREKAGKRNRRVDGEGDDEDEEDGEVLREWGGVCLGVVRMGVGSGAGPEQPRGSRVDAPVSLSGHGREV